MSNTHSRCGRRTAITSSLPPALKISLGTAPLRSHFSSEQCPAVSHEKKSIWSTKFRVCTLTRDFERFSQGDREEGEHNVKGTEAGHCAGHDNDRSSNNGI